MSYGTVHKTVKGHAPVVWRTRAGNMIASGAAMVILVSNVLPHRDAGLKAIISGVCVIIGEARRTGYVSVETHVQTLCLTRISLRKHDIIHHVVARYLSFTRQRFIKKYSRVFPFQKM